MEKQNFIVAMKSALGRGYSIGKIIQSFINAGYNKEDVIDSAKSVAADSGLEIPAVFLQTSQQVIQPAKIYQPQQIPARQTSQFSPQIKTPVQPLAKQIETADKISSVQETAQQFEMQADADMPGSGKKVDTIFVVFAILAAVLFVSLVSLIIFKDRVISFFNNLPL